MLFLDWIYGWRQLFKNVVGFRSKFILDVPHFFRDLDYKVVMRYVYNNCLLLQSLVY